MIYAFAVLLRLARQQFFDIVPCKFGLPEAPMSLLNVCGLK
jgi:hypothetical protein